MNSQNTNFEEHFKNLSGSFAVEGIDISNDLKLRLKSMFDGLISYRELVNSVIQSIKG